MTGEGWVRRSRPRGAQDRNSAQFARIGKGARNPPGRMVCIGPRRPPGLLVAFTPAAIPVPQGALIRSPSGGL